MGQGAGHADEGLATRDLEAALTAARWTLPPRCREAFILRRAAGLSVADVALRLAASRQKQWKCRWVPLFASRRARLRDWTR